MTARLPDEWRVPAAFALLVTAGLVYSASHAWFWQRAHDVAWVAFPLGLVLVVLLMRRSRIAWWVLVSIFAVGVVTDVVHLSSGHFGKTWIVGEVLGLVEFGLLVSPQMRRFIRSRERLAPSPS